MLQVPFELVLEQLWVMPGRNGLAAIFKALQWAEVASMEKELGPVENDAEVPVCMLSRLNEDEAMANPVQLDCRVVIPLPTEDQWKDAMASNLDLQLIVQWMSASEPKIGCQALLKEKGYWNPFINGRLEVEGGLVYHYEEPCWARIHQLRTRVVPPSLRGVVIAACHALPFAGHSGRCRTYYQVVTRFWWPMVSHDVNQMVSGCGHC